MTPLARYGVSEPFFAEKRSYNEYYVPQGLRTFALPYRVGTVLFEKKVGEQSEPYKASLCESAKKENRLDSRISSIRRNVLY